MATPQVELLEFDQVIANDYVNAPFYQQFCDIEGSLDDSAYLTKLLRSFQDRDLAAYSAYGYGGRETTHAGPTNSNMQVRHCDRRLGDPVDSKCFCLASIEVFNYFMNEHFHRKEMPTCERSVDGLQQHKAYLLSSYSRRDWKETSHLTLKKWDVDANSPERLTREALSASFPHTSHV